MEEKNLKTIVTFSSWGNYTPAFKSLFKMLGLEVVVAERSSAFYIAQGAKLAPELYCFPMKVSLGNILFGLKKGANTVFMVQNVGGSCRQRYYGAIQKKILEETGYSINFLDFRLTPKDIYFTLKKISGLSFFRILEASIFFFKKLWFIEKIERIAQYLRPREIKKGESDKVLDQIFEGLEKIKDQKAFFWFKKESLEKLKKIKIENKKNLPRVGLIGEIYTVCDPQINFEVEKKLGLAGIEVWRQMNITYHIKKLLFPWIDWKIQKKIMPYLKSTVGGHGRDAVYEMLEYAKKDFDGVVQLLPMGCMPEVSVRPILEKIHQKTKIPFLSLSLDEETAQVGIDTRLEAFVDVVKNYYQLKKKKNF